MKPQKTHPTPTPEMLKWLKDYKGNFPFYLSIRAQYDSEGWLSEGQQKKITEAINRDAQKLAAAQGAPAPVRLKSMANPTYPAGTVVEVRKWFANVVAKDMGLNVAYRNFEILQTFAESAKAIQVEIKLSPKFGRNCSVCGAELDTEISRATGVGPVCAKKMGITRYTKGSAQDVLKEIEAKIAALKSYGPQWVPRSQIKGIVGEEVRGDGPKPDLQPDNMDEDTAEASDLGWAPGVWPTEFTDRGETFKFVSREIDKKENELLAVIYRSEKRQLRVFND